MVSHQARNIGICRDRCLTARFSGRTRVSRPVQDTGRAAWRAAERTRSADKRTGLPCRF